MVFMGKPKLDAIKFVILFDSDWSISTQTIKFVTLNKIVLLCAKNIN